MLSCPLREIWGLLGIALRVGWWDVSCRLTSWTCWGAIWGVLLMGTRGEWGYGDFTLVQWGGTGRGGLGLGGVARFSGGGKLHWLAADGVDTSLCLADSYRVVLG